MKSSYKRKFTSCPFCGGEPLPKRRFCSDACSDAMDRINNRDYQRKMREASRKSSAKLIEEPGKVSQKPIEAIPEPSTPSVTPEPISPDLSPLAALNARLCQMHLGSR